MKLLVLRLTSFVLRTFGKAQRYVFIDPEVINSARNWLTNLQNKDGCFIRQGRLFNNRMKVCTELYSSLILHKQVLNKQMIF